jgi:hypothetical protein
MKVEVAAVKTAGARPVRLRGAITFQQFIRPLQDVFSKRKAAMLQSLKKMMRIRWQGTRAKERDHLQFACAHRRLKVVPKMMATNSPVHILALARRGRVTMFPAYADRF